MFFRCLRYLIPVIICCASLSQAMENKLIIGEIQARVVDGGNLYSAKIQLPSKETAYFISEPITTLKQGANWWKYSDNTEKFCSGRGFVLSVLQAWESNDLTEGNIESSLDSFFGENNDNKKTFVELIKTTKTTTKAIEGIASGCAGMNHTLGVRINYIVKNPQETLFPFPEQQPERGDINGYIKAYDNIIMSVSTYSGRSDVAYTHRGIFRNPFSMLRGDYKGLALPLHAFSACVWHLEFPKVLVMGVSPDGNEVMRQLLLKEFNTNERDVRNTAPSTNKELYHLRSDYKIWDEIIVSVEALEKRFLQNNQN